MLISAIIPSFNRAGFLLKAVESVLEQNDADFELIVVDDGSSDHTPDLLRGISDSRLKILRQENRGVSAARNAGLKLARGEVFALLDSDDYWLPGKLAKQLKFMRDGGLEICQTQEIWIRKGKRVNPRDVHVKPSGKFFEQALKMCLVSPSCVMFSRRLWQKVGEFDESLPACEDYDYWLRTLRFYEVGLLDEALTVKQGGHADQLSRSVMGLDLYRIYALIKLLKASDILPEEREAALAELARKTRIYVSGCLKRGRHAEALRVARLSGLPGLLEDCAALAG